MAMLSSAWLIEWSWMIDWSWLASAWMIKWSWLASAWMRNWLTPKQMQLRKREQYLPYFIQFQDAAFVSSILGTIAAPTWAWSMSYICQDWKENTSILSQYWVSGNLFPECHLCDKRTLPETRLVWESRLSLLQSWHLWNLRRSSPKIALKA